MTSASPRQEQILRYIRHFLQDNGYSPSVREIAGHLGVASPNAVHEQLTALKKKGLLDAGAGHRSLVPAGHKSTVQVPLVGRVRAGLPILAEENMEGTIAVDKDMAKGSKLFALRVTGDSMKDAGILDKDAVIVRAQPTADPGRIVVAMKDDEATVKHYRKRRGQWFLDAANPAYAPLPAGGYMILGVVVGLVRQYD